MKRTLIGLVLTALLLEALPSFAEHCAPKQAALRATHSCCASVMGQACAAACASKRDGHQDLRPATAGLTLKTFSNTIASQDLTPPAMHLAVAGSSTATSPAPIPRRYLRICTLRL